MMESQTRNQFSKLGSVTKPNLSKLDLSMHLGVKNTPPHYEMFETD